MTTAVTASSLSLRLVGEPAVVLAERGEDVSDLFWSELRLAWGFDGNPHRAIRVPVSLFLRRLDWLKPACVRHRVSLSWDPKLRELVAGAVRDRQTLDGLLDGVERLSDDEVQARLTGTRFIRDLRPFQMRDVGHLLALPHGANFSVPGAGKTTVEYAVYEAERAAGRVDRMLVVAPLSAFDAWATEVDECFAPGQRPRVEVFDDFAPAAAEVLLVNYHRLAGYYDEVAAWVRNGQTLVVLDEAHRMKAGRNGLHGSSCLDLAFDAVRRDILSGTPAPQSANDFVALIDYMWPGQATRVLPPTALVPRPPSSALSKVAQTIAPLFVRTTKDELELDEPKKKVKEVPLDGLHAAIYQSLRDRYAGELQLNMSDRNELSRMGTITMYLLEAATNPHLLAAGSIEGDDAAFRHPPLPVEPGSRLWDLIQRYNQYETPKKFAVLADIVATNASEGRKTLVWSNFVRNLLALERMFARYDPALVYGGMPPTPPAPGARSREGELKKFRDPDSECMVLLANPAAMSEGISLHKVCHDAVYLDRTFNAGQYLQSIDRIHRLGLKPGVETRLTFLVTTGTVDEIVDTRIKQKADNLGQMLADPRLSAMALPDPEDYTPAPEIDDLAALFAHLRGE